MSFLRSLYDKLKSGVKSVKPLPAPIDVVSNNPKVRGSLRAMATMPQTQSFIRQANQANAQRFDPAIKTLSRSLKPVTSPLKFGKDVTQGIARSGGSIGLSLMGRPELRQQDSVAPRAQSFLFGNEPLESIGTRIQRFPQRAEQFGVSQKYSKPLAAPAIIGLTAMDFTGTGAGKKLIKGAKLTPEIKGLISELKGATKFPDRLGTGLYGKVDDYINALQQFGNKINPDELRNIRETVEMINSRLTRTDPREVTELGRAGFSKRPLSNPIQEARKYKTPEEFIDTNKTIKVPISDFQKTDLQGWNEAVNNVRAGNISKASGPVEVVMTPDGYKLIEGNHRAVQALNSGNSTIEARLISKEGLDKIAQRDGPHIKIGTQNVFTKSQLIDIWKKANGQAGFANIGEGIEGAKETGRNILRRIKGQGGSFKQKLPQELLSPETATSPSSLSRRPSSSLARIVVPPEAKATSQVTSPYSNNAVDIAKGKVVDLNKAIVNKRNQLIEELKKTPTKPLGEVDVKQKVNILDKFKTPADVYTKAGLEKEAEALRLSEIQAKREVPVHIEKIQEWVKRAENPENVFDFLDGKAVQLTPNENQVAQEIKGYLSAWADRLGLPKEQRVTNYITRLFEPELAKKEFDPQLAKLITDKVPGSVYDPFLEKRLGKLGYKRDLGLALEVYAKRGIRKANFDPVLSILKDRSKQLEQSQLSYVKKNLQRVNLRPTEIDNHIDNFIKSSPVGYKLGQRPTNYLTRLARTVGYRGTLGGNLSSPLKNLTQGVNTYAKLGEKYTLTGYLKTLKPGSKRELEQVGVLDNSFIDDRAATTYKKLLQKVDSGLYYGFEKAEQINRGAAYYGAKQKALDAGKSLDEAILEGLKTARETQFTFGNVDTPEILASDIMKTFGQFQSFNLKQAEFLGKMVKNKEYAGLARWVIANAIVVGTIGKLIGYDAKDVIPFSSVATGETKLGQTPAISAGVTAVKAITGAPNKYGQPTGAKELGNALIPLIPGGVQAKKTLQGAAALSDNASSSASGRVRYPVPNDLTSAFRTLVFGQYSGKIGRFYFDNALTPLGDKDSAKYRRLVSQGKDPVQVWQMISKQRIERSYKKKLSDISKDKTLTPKQKAAAKAEAKRQAQLLLSELLSL